MLEARDVPLNTEERAQYVVPLGEKAFVESVCRTVKKDLVDFLGMANWAAYLACLRRERERILARFVWPEEGP